MTAPVRIRGRRVIRRAAATQDVAFTLLQMHRPRRDDLRFGLFLFGEALHGLPVEDAPKAADEPDELDQPQAADHPDQPVELPPEATAPPEPEDDDAAEQPAEAAQPYKGYVAPQDHYATVQEFHAEVITPGDTVPVVDASPDTVVSTSQPGADGTTPGSDGGSPGGEDPGGADPVDEVPVEDVTDSPTDIVPTEVVPADVVATDVVGVSPSTAQDTVSEGSDPDDDDDDDEVPEPQQMPGIYICVEQDATGGTDTAVSVDVEGAYSYTYSGTSDPTLTTYEVVYLADTASAGDLPDSIWAAGWQQVILSFEILDTQSWVQTANIDVEQNDSDTGIQVDAEQLTWITEKGEIFISAHADGWFLYVDTRATLFTEVNQITNVAVRVGTLGLSTAATEEGDGDGDPADPAIDASLPIDIDLVQDVSLEQDVSVTVEVEDGLDLNLDALLGQIGTVLQEFELSVEVEGDELTLNLCADQEADISQTVSLVLGVEEPSPESREESDGGDTALAAAEQTDEDLGALLESSFAAGDDLSFDDTYDTWAASTAAGEVMADEAASVPVATPTPTDGVVDAGAEVDADPDFDEPDDSRHYAAA